MQNQRTIETLIAGFGGQGVLSAGKVLAFAALYDGREVSWMPSYGPEQRGGTANATVIVSAGAISSPIVSTFDAAILLSRQSVSKFAGSVRSGGLLVCDSSVADAAVARPGVDVLSVDAAAEAEAAGSVRAGCMVMLGVLIGRTRMIDAARMAESLRHVLPPRHHDLIDVNMRALRRGMAIAGS